MIKNNLLFATICIIAIIMIGCKNKVTDPASEESSTIAPNITGITTKGDYCTSELISWATDVPCTAQVLYGADTSYGSQTPELPIDPNNTTNTYKAYLPGLQPDTKYHFMVKAKNAQGQIKSSEDGIFTTLPFPGSVMTIISNVQVVNIQPNQVTITFTSSKSKTGVVSYGTDLTYSKVADEDIPTINHSIILSPLNSNTKYYFYVGFDYASTPGQTFVTTSN